MAAIDSGEEWINIPRSSQELWSNVEALLHLDSVERVLLLRVETWHSPGSWKNASPATDNTFFLFFE